MGIQRILEGVPVRIGKDLRLRFRQTRLGQIANKLKGVKGNGHGIILYVQGRGGH